MKKVLEKHHVFYGWVMVVAGAVILGCSWGFINNCYPLSIAPLTELHGYERGLFAINQTVRFLVYALVTGMTGKLFKRFGVMKLMRISCFVSPAALLVFNHSGSIPVVYLAAAIAGAALAFNAFPAMTVVISNWFDEKRGLALGITFMGSGLGGMLFNALSGQWIEKYGILTCTHIQAALFLLISLPIVFFVLKERPEDIGLHAYCGENAAVNGYGENPDGNDQNGKRVIMQTPPYGYTLKEGIRRPGFWNLFVLILTIGIVSCISSSFFVPYCTDLGFNAAYAAYLNAAYLGLVSFSKILAGRMYDKMSIRTVTLILVAALIPNYIALLFADHSITHIIWVLTLGFGNSVGTVSYAILTQGVMGNKDYVTVCGIMTAAGSAGGAVGPLISNIIYSSQGSYYYAFVVGLILNVLCIVSLLFMRTLKRPDPVAVQGK